MLPVVFDIPAGPFPCLDGYVVLVLDITSRLHYKTYPDRGIEGLREMAANIVRVMSRLHRDAKFAVVTYDNVTMVKDFASYSRPDDWEAYILSLTFAENVYESNIAAGLLAAQRLLERARASSSMTILISDGEATIDSGIEQTYADNLRSIGSKVILIAVSKTYDIRKLEGITRNNPSHFTAERYVFDATLLSSEYKPCTRGQNSVSALRDNSESSVCPKELVFVIDSSGNMNGNEWDDMKTFLRNLVGNFSVLSPGMKFGSVLYGDNANLGFYLSDNMFDIKLRLKNLLHLGGGTHVARGLNAARQYMFEDNGASKAVMLLMTGNPSQVIETYKEATNLRRNKIAVKVVGITQTPSHNIMDNIAAVQGGVVRIDEMRNLPNEIQNVIDLGCPSEGQQRIGGL